MAVAEPISAQRGDTLVLGLDQALEIARRNNPAYRRARNELALNGPEARAAWAREILPRVDLNLLTGYSGNLQRRATDPFGNPVANPDADYVYFSSTRQGVAVSWQLQGPSIWHRKERLDAANAGRALGEDIAGQRLRVELQRRFFDALEEEELLAAEEAVADASGSDLEIALGLFELVMKTRVDVLQAQLQVEQRRLAVSEQAGRRDQARIALRTLLGRQDLPPVRPGRAELPVFDPAGLDEDALVRRAVAGSAPVRQEEAALRQADALVAQSRAVYWPTLSAGWQLGRYVQAQQSASLFSFGGLDDALYGNFTVQLSVPFLNDVTGSQLQIARAEVQREDQRDALRGARLAAEQAARSALVTLRNRWQGLQIAERSLAIAREALELEREEYRLGGSAFEQLQQSVRFEADARRHLVRARYDFVDALLDLEVAVGGSAR